MIRNAGKFLGGLHCNSYSDLWQMWGALWCTIDTGDVRNVVIEIMHEWLTLALQVGDELAIQMKNELECFLWFQSFLDHQKCGSPP